MSQKTVPDDLAYQVKARICTNIVTDGPSVVAEFECATPEQAQQLKDALERLACGTPPS